MARCKTSRTTRVTMAREMPAHEVTIRALGRRLIVAALGLAPEDGVPLMCHPRTTAEMVRLLMESGHDGWALAVRIETAMLAAISMGRGEQLSRILDGNEVLS